MFLFVACCAVLTTAGVATAANGGFTPETAHSPNATRTTAAYWLILGFTAAIAASTAGVWGAMTSVGAVAGGWLVGRLGLVSVARGAVEVGDHEVARQLEDRVRRALVQGAPAGLGAAQRNLNGVLLASAFCPEGMSVP